MDILKELVRKYLADNPDFIENLVPTQQEIDNAISEFRGKFSPEKLKQMTDKEILRWIPFNPISDRDTLSYYLEHHKILKNFGGIGGGSAGKMGFYQGKDGQYKNNHDRVTTKEEVLKYRKIDIEFLEEAYKYIDNDDFDGLDGYINVLNNSANDEESLYKATLPSFVWVRKYFAIMFPEKFIQIFGRAWCDRIGEIFELGDVDGKIDGYGAWYKKMNQIASIAPELGINTNVMSNVMWRQPEIRGEKIEKTDNYQKMIEIYLSYINKVGIQNHINAEGYKFEDLKIFQENFNTEAEDIHSMIDKSIVADNLSGSGNYFPRRMLLAYAEFDQEGVREALRTLSDISKPLKDRVNGYTILTEEIHKRRDESMSQSTSTYQDARFISLLLSFMQPNEFAYYKNTELAEVIKISRDERFKIAGDNVNKIEVARNFCMQIQSYLEENNKAKPIIEAFSSIYPEIEDNLWLAQDVYLNVSRNNKNKDVGDNNKNINFWIFQGNPDVFDIEEYLSSNVGKVINWSANQSVDLMNEGDIIYFWSAKDGGLAGLGTIINTPKARDGNDDEQRFGEKKVDIKLLRYFEEKNRIKRSDLQENVTLAESKIVKQPQGSNFLLTEDEAFELQKIIAKKLMTQVWVFTPGSNNEFLADVKENNRIRIGWDKLGDLRLYNHRDDIKSALQEHYEDGGENQVNNTTACDDFLSKMQPGDIVILKNGLTGISSIGHITGDYDFDKNLDKFNSLRPAVFSLFREWQYDPSAEPKFSDAAKNLPVKTMTDMSPYPELVERIINCMPLNNNKITEKPPMPESLNTILYGPPGTGKTYQALNVYAKNLLSGQTATTQNYEEVLADELKDLTWHEVTALTLSKIGHHVKVREISEHPIIKSYAEFVKNRTTSYIPTIWGQLQYRSDVGSSNHSNKIEAEPYFNKNENSEWGLTDEGRVFVEETLSDINLDIQPTEQSDWKKFYRTITFHQSYSYEEFVEGIRPIVDPDQQDGEMKFTIKDGIFKEMCTIAKRDSKNKYLLIIDEINRGNISKIFGELITLLEPDKRAGQDNEITVQLPYSQDSFTVPSNLYVLGTMNTADRSIALLDIALRRRFTFNEIMPELELVSTDVAGVNIRELLKVINSKVEIMIDRDHQIGHSYLQKVTTINEIHEAWYTRIVPLLQEYFYNDWERLEKIIGKHNGNTGFINSVSEASIVKLFGNDTEYTDTKVGSIHRYNSSELATALRSLYEQNTTS